MCRLLGYVSDNKTNFTKLLKDDFPEFVDLSNVHGDGWGIATDNSFMFREVNSAAKSAKFSQTISQLDSTGALLHFRWATPGLAIKEENTHPFTHKGFSFIHNGSLKEVNALDSLIDPRYFNEIKGDADSERFFYFLLTQIDKNGFVEGVKSGIETMRKSVNYSSINCMIMNEDTYIVVAEHNPERIPPIFKADYYELRYKHTTHDVIVGSSGWNQSGWTLIPNHSMLVINRQNFSCEVIFLN